MKNIKSIRENNFIINQITGKVTTREIYTYAVENMSSWEGTKIIWDFSGAKLNEVTPEDWKKLAIDLLPHAKQDAKQRPVSKEAFVADTDNNLSYGMTRMMSAYTEIEKYPFKFECFRTVDDAKKWLSE